MELHTYQIELVKVCSPVLPATLRVGTADLMLPTASSAAQPDWRSAALLAWAVGSGVLSGLEPESEVGGHAELLGARRAYAVIDHPLTGPRLAVEFGGYLLPFAGLSELGTEDFWTDHSQLLNLNLAEHLADHAQLLERSLAPDPVEVRDSLIRAARAHQQALKLGDSRLSLAAENGYEMHEKARSGQGAFSGRRAVLRCEVRHCPEEGRASAVMHWFGY